MATDIESAFRALKNILSLAAAGSDALPNEVKRNASLRDMFGEITGTSQAYLNLIDDDPVLYDTVIGPAPAADLGLDQEYQDEFGQRAVIEFIVSEVNSDRRDAVFADGLAAIAKAMRGARTHPLFASLDVLAPERANLAAGPLPGIKAVRITVEFLLTAPDMLGNVLADRVTATIEPITMSSDVELERGAALTAVLDPILAASQAEILLDALLASGIEAVLSSGDAVIKLEANAAPGFSDILGSGDSELLIGLTGAGVIGDILGSGVLEPPLTGLGGNMAVEPLLGSGDASATVESAIGGIIGEVLGSGNVFTAPGANLLSPIDPILGSGQTDILVAAQSGGVLEPVGGSGAVAVALQALSGGNIETILSAAQAGQPLAVLSGGGFVADVLSSAAAQAELDGQLAGLFDPILGIGDATLVLGGEVSANLEDFLGVGSGTVAANASSVGQIDPILSEADLGRDIAADAASSLDPVISASQTDILAAIASAPTLDPILGAGDADAPAKAAGNGLIEDLQGAGDVASHAGAVAASSIAPLVGSGDGRVLVQASSGGQVGAFLGAGDAAVTSPSSNEAETDALLARMTVAPSAARETNINQLIAGLKTDALWAKLDVLYLFAAHTQQAALLNLKGATFNATNSNTASWTANSGFTGNTLPEATFGLLTGFDLSSDRAAASGHFGAWYQRAAGGGEGFLMASNFLGMYDLGTLDQTAFINWAGAETGSDAISAAEGHFFGQASFPGSVEMFHSGVDVSGGSITALSNFGTGELRFMGEAAGGLMKIAHGGDALTATEISNLHTRFDTYLTAIASE